MARQEFLDGKLIIMGEEDLQQSRDVLVNFCTPNIFSGGDLLREIHEFAGPSLETECRRYCGLGSGCCRLTDSFEAKQYKKIAHCILPAPKQSEKHLSEIDYFDFALAYRSALDMSAEAGYKTILFTHPYFYSHKLIASIAVATIKKWLDSSTYNSQLNQIVIMCGSEDLFHLYTDILTASTDEFDDLIAEVFWDTAERPEVSDYTEDVNIKLFESLMQSPEFDASFDNPIYYTGGHYPTTSQYCMERYGFDEAYIHEHSEQLYDELFKTPDGLQLQLSRNLSATILTIEEETGLLRQYRMTTQNREGDTCYFRCSRCESLMKHTNSDYRPKITVKNGYIFGNCYPEHHPECFPATKEAVIVQQMDREARMSLLRPGYDYPLENPVKPELFGAEGSDQPMPEFGDWRYNHSRSNGFTKGSHRGFADEEYIYHNPGRSIVRPALATSINNTLEAIRKCETELDEDYSGASDVRIRDEDFTRVMVGDLQHNNFVQNDYVEKLNNENDAGKVFSTNDEGDKIVDNEASESDVAINNDNNPNFDLKITSGNIGCNEHQLEEITEEEFPHTRHPKMINLSSSSIVAFKPTYSENDSFGDVVEANTVEEQPIVTKCRKYRIIRERRRTNVAFDWRNEENAEAVGTPIIPRKVLPDFNSVEKVNNEI